MKWRAREGEKEGEKERGRERRSGRGSEIKREGVGEGTILLDKVIQSLLQC